MFDSLLSLNGFLFEDKHTPAIPIKLVHEIFEEWLEQQSTFVRNWSYTHFSPEKPWVSIPNENGNIDKVFLFINKEIRELASELCKSLPKNHYRVENGSIHSKILENFYLGWGLEQYQFQNYITTVSNQNFPTLLLPSKEKNSDWYVLLEAIYLIRNLINLPSNDLMPADLARISRILAKKLKASCRIFSDEKHLQKQFPALYAVGQGSHHKPCLIDFSWGDPKHKKITLVGKGVCFDSGGLNIKPSSGMKLMKKDMGGAAHVLGLAYLIMKLNLPIALRILIPAVENAIGSRSYRPGDILKTKKGLFVEIGNTDAEGRLILSDALTEACNQNPDLIIDFATLTGAARVALGTEIPILFSNDEILSEKLLKISQNENDLIWKLPLYQGYRDLFKSRVADLNNVGEDSYGGAIIAALFLETFISPSIPWMHLDLMAWNLTSRPGKPEGGEAMGIFSFYHFLKNFVAHE